MEKISFNYNDYEVDMELKRLSHNLTVCKVKQDVLKRYADVRQIELVTDNTEKTAAFYKSLGFKELTEIGCCGFMRCS